MWSWLQHLIPFAARDVGANGVSLPSAGYTEEYARERVAQIRDILLDMRQHGSDLAANLGGRESHQVPELADRACTSIEKVLQNLKRDPKDFSRMGLALESVPPLEKLLGHCLKFVCTNMSEQKIDESLRLAASSLVRAEATFDRLAENSLQIDDTLNAESLQLLIDRLLQ